MFSNLFLSCYFLSMSFLLLLIAVLYFDWDFRWGYMDETNCDLMYTKYQNTENEEDKKKRVNAKSMLQIKSRS